ncbi:3-hydroxyacyl-CoA dehydrogenase NAD-binding domain-containing protein [Tabrizicola sp. BL-A-41-H6]|uniref:3-hydroxyacyl-CoA dehydrogenase NAD-binding domain-containing protein n=1 Tax=Tabrizicola sp. BL-A-41-H6 TaxID=3421107 RepID=UPI003D67BA10
MRHVNEIKEKVDGAMLPGLNVVILGAGSIGLSFAASFADAGFDVTLADPDAARRDAASTGIATQVDAIALAGLRRGGAGQIDVLPDATAQVRSAALVIEAGPEDLAVKQAIFARLLSDAPADAVLATASSAIVMSRILPDAADQARCLVAHPVNPPAVLRMIEIVPAPATLVATQTRASALFETAGFTPVVLNHEIDGFVLNRLQGAVLREAYRLVGEGVVDAAAVDAVMRLGLGPRWALSGPFETAELNTPGGIRAHAARMGPAYRAMGEARGETGCLWPDDLVARIDAERRRVIAVEDLPARAAWRAQAVARLVALRDELARDADDS